MPNNLLRILNLDDSVAKQNRLIAQYQPEIIDLRDLGPRARIWLDSRTKDIISRRIRGRAGSFLNFLGSGDFHHLSCLLLEQFSQPFSVISFDFHPDWDILPPRLGCGSWVSASLKNKNIAKFMLLGVSSADISSLRIQSGNLRAWRDKTVEVYPYSHPPTQVFSFSYPFVSKIYWEELRGRDLEEFFPQALKHLPTQEVYISIDKDCLKKEFARTNWEEGRLSLGELLAMLKLIRQNRRIIGVDIVGDYSEPVIKSRIKSLLAKFDHPQDYSARGIPPELANSLNEETNLKILNTLEITAQ